MGPFAIDQKMVHATGASHTTVRIFNTNTKKVIHATFPLDVEGRADLKGDFAIDGVSGTGSRINLDFIRPGGSKTGSLLPTGNVIDTLSPSTVLGFSGAPIEVSLLDCGNPCVFVRAEDIEMNPTTLPADLEKDVRILSRLEQIRMGARIKMGLAESMEDAAKVRSVPKVCVVSPPTTHTVLSGQIVEAGAVDIVVRCVSSGDPHRALPITASLCLAAALKVAGSIPNRAHRPRAGATDVIIGHPSGTIAVDASVEKDAGGVALEVGRATVARTARKLFEGEVFID